MAEIVYILCGLTSLACATLLWRGYRKTRARLLMWSSLCFTGLAINNALLFVDKVLVPDVSLAFLEISVAVWRSLVALAGLLLLLYGLIWEAER